jgi:hypothetical protein
MQRNERVGFFGLAAHGARCGMRAEFII